MADAVFTETGTCSYTLLQGYVAEEVHPNARRRCVGNAHFSDAQNAASLSGTVIDKSSPHMQCLMILLCIHGGFVAEVACAPVYLTIEDGRLVA